MRHVLRRVFSHWTAVSSAEWRQWMPLSSSLWTGHDSTMWNCLSVSAGTQLRWWHPRQYTLLQSFKHTRTTHSFHFTARFQLSATYQCRINQETKTVQECHQKFSRVQKSRRTTNCTGIVWTASRPSAHQSLNAAMLWHQKWVRN